MGEIYPYIADIGAEYQLATGQRYSLVAVHFEFLQEPGGSFRVVARVYPEGSGTNIPTSKLKLLSGLVSRAGEPNSYDGPTITSNNGALVRPYIRPFLLYHQPYYHVTPVCSRHLLLPEEIPILIASFHMSNVVRYKPEFLAKLRDSRYWPMLSAMQRHCLLKFLILFWSFVHQRELHIKHGTA